VTQKTSFSNVEIVTFAAYLLGGESQHVDTEDIAVKVNQLASGRFAWRKYPDQINLGIVQTGLSDAKKEKNGYLLGSGSRGWLLSENGLKFCRENIGSFQGVDLSRAPLTAQERRWRRLEKTRMLASQAFKTLTNLGSDFISMHDAEAFFRVDDYVTGHARTERLTRIRNAFGDDAVLGEAVRILAEKVRKI
jgi:hypothetical protein